MSVTWSDVNIKTLEQPRSEVSQALIYRWETLYMLFTDLCNGFGQLKTISYLPNIQNIWTDIQMKIEDARITPSNYTSEELALLESVSNALTDLLSKNEQGHFIPDFSLTVHHVELNVEGLRIVLGMANKTWSEKLVDPIVLGDFLSKTNTLKLKIKEFFSREDKEIFYLKMNELNDIMFQVNDYVKQYGNFVPRSVPTRADIQRYRKQFERIEVIINNVCNFFFSLTE